MLANDVRTREGGWEKETAVKYPKIETLYNRDKETFRALCDELRRPEFGPIKHWFITEKIEGTNVRVMLLPDGHVKYRGRTDRVQFHPNLIAYLETAFPPEKLQTVFNQKEGGQWPPVICYGEGYGPKIQSGGIYRDDIAFRLFDVWIDGWWLNWSDVEGIAQGLGIKTVPVLGTITDYLPTCMGELLDLFPGRSIVALEEQGEDNCRCILPEGVVARTVPLLFTRKGDRVMWKLKFKDF